MGEPIFLISGATGATGGAAAEQLLAKKRHVRVLAHRQDDRSERLKQLGAEVVFGDFLEFEEMRGALKGVQRAYFCYPIRPGIVQATAHFAQAAKEYGVEFIVNMSQKSARENAKSHAAQQHWLSERVFRRVAALSRRHDSSGKDVRTLRHHRLPRAHCRGGPGPRDRRHARESRIP